MGKEVGVEGRQHVIRLVLWNEQFGKRVRKGGWEEIDGGEVD